MNREIEIIEKIKKAIESLDEIDEMIDTQSAELQSTDLELSDLYHLIEQGRVSKEASTKIIKRIEELRLKRRALNNEHEIESTYLTHKSKMTGKDTRSFLASEIHKTVNKLNCDYKFRVLSDDDINELLSTKKKAGRPKKEKVVEQKILDMVLEESNEKK